MQEMLLSGPVSIHALSPGLDPAAVEAVVIMPTFRRPDHALSTLQSIAAQRTARRFAVVVMENDAERLEGAMALGPLFEGGELRGLLIVVHERGNCRAYNAGFEVALRRFPRFRHLAVIDDDEVAGPEWLENLCCTAERLGADMVGAPQVPVFAAPDLPATAAHPVFRPHYDATGPVPMLFSSGNLLLSRRVLEAMGPPHLELKFNFLGGGDSDFLSRAEAKGFRAAWCAEAPVFETVPARRLEMDWIRARSLRNGVISTLVEKRRRAGTSLANLRVLAKSLALFAASPLRGLMAWARTGSPMDGTYPFYVASGRLLAEFGYAREQYREPEKN